MSGAPMLYSRTARWVYNLGGWLRAFSFKLDLLISKDARARKRYVDTFCKEADRQPMPTWTEPAKKLLDNTKQNY